MKRALAIGWLSIFAVLAAAQTFELAEIHPGELTANPDTRDLIAGFPRKGVYHLLHATMLDLVSTAYGVNAKKVVGGPTWLELDRFDVRAKVPAGASAATVRPMLQSLLAERFGLVVHQDTKPVSAWVLTAGKHPQLRRSDGTGASGCHSNTSGDFVEVACRNVTMAAAMSDTSNMDGAWYYIGDNLLVEQTGLEGAWDFDLKYSRRWTATTPGARTISLFDAFEKLGLTLDPGQVPMPVVVVGKVNRISTPNSPEAEKAFPLPTEFEVADVKSTNPDYHGDSFQVERSGRLTLRGHTLQWLMADAWGITPEMIVGAPKFMDSDRWDVVAKAPDMIAGEGDADIDSLRVMVKSLLADRFKLTAHYEERSIPAYVMVAVKPKLKKADPASRAGCSEGPPTLMKVEPRSTNPVLGRLLTCTNVSMEWFARELQFLASSYVHGGVLDATGLEGGWDFTLSFSKMAQYKGGSGDDPNGSMSAPEAMEKQLGLKLELRKRPVQVLVIDHIDEKPTDN